MAGFHTAVVLLAGLLLGLCTAEDVPVFVWGVQSRAHRSNPLERTTTEEFEGVLRSELSGAPFLVAFIEENLSVEDLSRRDTKGATSLQYLHSNVGDSIYLPAVQSPIRAINKLADAEPELADRVRLTESGLSASVRPSGTALLVVELSDAREGETRAELLGRHDRFMRDTVSELSGARGDVLAVYTAHYPSWSVAEMQSSSRTRRSLLQAAVVDEPTPVANAYNISGDLLLYLTNLTVSTRGGPPVAVAIPAGGPTVSKNETLRTMSATVESAGYTVRLHFKSQSGYWFLDEADVTSSESGESESIASATVFAIDGFSYHCSSSIRFTGPNSTFALTLTDFQIQPFFDGSGRSFGDSFDCTGFTSVPIWSGLFVVFIMLAIFFYGVGMMMDIRTMDRFDDPKGKTITINASE